MKENATLEFKSSISDSFLKTVSAFANYGGGKILFGYGNEGEVKGLQGDLDKLCLLIENKINSTLSPRPFYSLKADEGNKTITLHVEEGEHKPYFYLSKAYIRVDTASTPLDQTQLCDLILQGRNLNYEETPSSKSDLSFAFLSKALENRLGVKLENNVLRTFGLLDKRGNYLKAAEILSDQPRQKGLDVAFFKDGLSQIVERETLDDRSIFSLIEEATSFFRRHYCHEEIEGMARKEVCALPKHAFREALINALAHRRYDLDARVRIKMDKTGVEIVSPGGLLQGVSPEEYLNGRVSIPRNPLIAEVLHRLGLMELFGNGILRIKEAYEGESVKPSFSIMENSIAVFLPIKGWEVAQSKGEKEVVEVLRQGPISSGALAERLSYSQDKVYRILTSLMARNYVKKTGNGRGTKYCL